MGPNPTSAVTDPDTSPTSIDSQTADNNLIIGTPTAYNNFLIDTSTATVRTEILFLDAIAIKTHS